MLGVYKDEYALRKRKKRNHKRTLRIRRAAFSADPHQAHSLDFPPCTGGIGNAAAAVLTPGILPGELVTDVHQAVPPPASSEICRIRCCRDASDSGRFSFPAAAGGGYAFFDSRSGGLAAEPSLPNRLYAEGEKDGPGHTEDRICARTRSGSRWIRPLPERRCADMETARALRTGRDPVAGRGPPALRENRTGLPGFPCISRAIRSFPPRCTAFSNQAFCVTAFRPSGRTEKAAAQPYFTTAPPLFK